MPSKHQSAKGRSGVERTFHKEKNNKGRQAEKPVRVPGREVRPGQPEHSAWQGNEENMSFEWQAGLDRKEHLRPP